MGNPPVGTSDLDTLIPRRLPQASKKNSEQPATEAYMKNISGIELEIEFLTPCAWIFHKGLTFPRRKAESKKLKDLFGIWYVGTQLGDFSISAIEEIRIYRRN